MSRMFILKPQLAEILPNCKIGPQTPGRVRAQLATKRHKSTLAVAITQALRREEKIALNDPRLVQPRQRPHKPVPGGYQSRRTLKRPIHPWLDVQRPIHRRHLELVHFRVQSGHSSSSAGVVGIMVEP
eukprot:FR737950.1.p1 GENE.FR737950.1~~FR737950.1.p1  ORF type:complete len:128 (-),score=3.24 FR737950.1:91-474(-)